MRNDVIQDWRGALDELGIPRTYRTWRVLAAILEHLGLIENTGLGAAHGKPNAWWLTAKGDEVRWELEAEGLA